MTADLEFGPAGDHGTAPQAGRGGPAWSAGAAAVPGGSNSSAPAVQPVRSPAMRAYCATLARFTSAVQSTEQLLRNDDAGTREDTEQRELTAASRLRGIDRAALAADDGLDHCATVRSAHGLALRPASWGTDDADLVLAMDDEDGFPTPDVAAGRRPAADRVAEAGHGNGRGTAGAEYASRLDPSGGAASAAGGHGRHSGTTGPDGLDRLRRSGGGADLGVALTSLGRRRDALRLADEEFAGWLAARDEQTRRVSLAAAAAAGLAGVAVMAVAGTRASAAMSLALLVACTLAVVGVGVGVAAARRSPRVCRGVGLARRPHPLGLARYAAQVGGLALLALAAANIGAGAL